MNLHAVVRGVIPVVNPDQTIMLLRSTGQALDGFQQVATWAPAEQVEAQVQPVSDKTLQWLQQSRQNSVWRDAYLFGPLHGLEHATVKGGDMLYFEGFEWQVDQVLEAWSATAGWTKVRCIQVRACPPPEEGSTARPEMRGATWPS